MPEHHSQLSDGESLRPARPPELQPEEGVEVPYELIPPSTLEELIKAFVLREGTDYGATEVPLDRKVQNILRQLERKELKIVFDLTADTGSIISAK